MLVLILHHCFGKVHLTTTRIAHGLVITCCLSSCKSPPHQSLLINCFYYFITDCYTLIIFLCCLVNFTANSTTDFVGNLDYTRSYQCKHSQNIKLGVQATPRNTSINASLTLVNLRVQSFEFKNYTTGEFGNG